MLRKFVSQAPNVPCSHAEARTVKEYFHVSDRNMFCWIHSVIYTVSHKKRATLFLIITPAFIGRFLYFLYQ